MAAGDPLPLDQQLCFSIYGASIAINRTYKPLLDQFGLTYTQYLVLNALWESDGQTVGAIAERLALEPSTITPLVKRLELAELVARRRSPEDERQVHVHLTETGKKLRKKIGCRLTDRLQQQSGLAVDELVALNRGVQALCDALTRQK